MTTQNLFSRFSKKVAETVFDTTAKTIGVAIVTALVGLFALIVTLAQQVTIGFLLGVVLLLIMKNLVSISQIFWIKKSRSFKGRNIFWLCNDIRHTQGALGDIQHAKRKHILDGIRRIYHHVKEAELGKELIAKSMRLRDDANTVIEWTLQARQIYFERVDSLFTDIAHELERRQPDFKSDPE